MLSLPPKVESQDDNVDEFSPPVSRGSGSEHVEEAEIPVQTKEESHPAKPHKPVKHSKPEKHHSDSHDNEEKSAKAAGAESTPGKPLTTKERLKLRQEALKQQKASAAKPKPAKPASPSPVKGATGGEELVQSFESYDDSFDS